MKRAKRLLCVLLTLVMLMGMLPINVLAVGNAPFKDVSVTDWYYDEVAYMYENNIMNGTGNRMFSPDNIVTRGMVVTILHRLEGLPFVSGMAFHDVDVDAYYGNAVVWACSQGIVNGYDNGNFGPNDPVTREQLVAMLYRYAKYAGKDVSSRADLTGYFDHESISDYAREAMSWAVAEGVISGMDCDHLAPTSTATRAQTATIISRTDIPKSQHEPNKEDTATSSDKPSNPGKPSKPSEPVEAVTILFVFMELAFENSMLEGYDIWNIIPTTGETALLAVPNGYEPVQGNPYQTTAKELTIQQDGASYTLLQPVTDIDFIRDFGSGGLDAGVKISNRIFTYGLSRNSQIPVTIIDTQTGILGTYPLCDCTMTFHQLLDTASDTLYLEFSLCFIGENGVIEGADKLTDAKEVVIFLTEVVEVARKKAFIADKVEKQFERPLPAENSFIYYDVFAAFVDGSPCYVILSGINGTGGSAIVEAGDMIEQYFETYCTDEETGYPVYFSRPGGSTSFAKLTLRTQIKKLEGMTLKELFNTIRKTSGAAISAETPIYSICKDDLKPPKDSAHELIYDYEWYGYLSAQVGTYANFEPFLNEPVEFMVPSADMRLCAAVSTVRIPTGSGSWRNTITEIWLWIEDAHNAEDQEDEEHILFTFEDVEDTFQSYTGIPEHYEAAQITLANGETVYLGVPEGAIGPFDLDTDGINTAHVKKSGTIGQWTGTSDETPLYLTTPGPNPVTVAPKAISTGWREDASIKKSSIRDRIEYAIDRSGLNICLSTYAEDIPVVFLSKGKRIKCLTLDECEMTFQEMFYPDAEEMEMEVTIYTTPARTKGNYYLAEELTEIWVDITEVILE